jgi:hypothetical protein
MNWREMEEEREGTVVIIIILEGENGSITIACFNNKANPITNS